MTLKQLLDQLNQVAKERPEALEMEVFTNQLGPFTDMDTYNEVITGVMLNQEEVVIY